MDLNKLKLQEEKLLTDLQFIDDLLQMDQVPDAEDVDAIIGHGMEIANVAALSAKTLADAKAVLLKRELLFMQANEQLWDKPTVLKKLMEGNLADNHQAVVWADRINAAIAHKLEFYRSVVSKYKEEMKINAMQNFNTKG